MAGSRIHKIGSIFERVSGLIECGVIKPNDKPIWLDVYKYHPPKYNPVFDRPPLQVQIKPIFYAEDNLRARIHKSKQVPVNLNENYKETRTEICQGLMKTGVALNEAIKMTSHKEIKPEETSQESTIFDDLEEIDSLS